MPRLLTVRKAKWVAQRKPDVVRGNPLNPNAAAENRYMLTLDKLIRDMVNDVEKQLKKLFETEHAEAYFAQDASIASQARIITSALTEKYSTMFAAASKPLAEKVADMADKSSSSSLHSSIQQLSGGLSLKTTALSGDIVDVFKATVNENVSLIKSIPSQYLTGVTQAVQRSILSGNGLADLVPYLQKHRGITERRAKSIAYDQTRKSFNNLNRARMQKLGLKQFEWLHTSGSREPRQLHIDYSGKIFSFDDLPIIDENTGERGIPGQAINCRCKMIPVINLESE